MTGADVWAQVRGQLQSGVTIRNWTVASGYVGSDFIVAEVGPDHVRVDLGGGRTRRVAASDFVEVGHCWADYCAGELRRDQISDHPNVNTKYVISILHHIGFH